MEERGGGGGGGHKPYFFKVLLPGFLEKLSFPPKFRQQHLTNDNHRKATILSPTGKSWSVRIHQDGQEMYFGDGWKDFARAHELCLGYFVVFCYQGNMVFSSEVFDLSECKVEYNATASKSGKQKGIKIEDQNPDEISEDASEEAPEDTPLTTLRRFVKKSKSEEPRLRKSHRRETPSPPISLRNCIYNSETSPHRFEKIVRAHNRSFMNVPRAFCVTNGLMRSGMITLSTPRGQSWQVYLHSGVRECYLRKGWREFSAGNKLKMGEKCIFQHVSNNVIQVRILRH